MASESSLLETQIALLDASASIVEEEPPRRTVDDVWREIVSGDNAKALKQESPDAVMTLEDFLLAKTAAAGSDSPEEDEDLKIPAPAKRGRSVVLEPLDRAAQQRQRRMIKNRESAARSRERKQAYQVELESLAVRLDDERHRLLQDKAQRTKERLKQLLEKVIPVEEKRRPPRVLRRVRSFEW